MLIWMTKASPIFTPESATSLRYYLVRFNSSSDKTRHVSFAVTATYILYLYREIAACDSSFPLLRIVMDLTFGPPGEEWHYSSASKTYDLSRDSATKLTLSTTEGPKDTSVTISPDSSALVVVDMQNFFLDPKCRHHPNGLNAVEPTIKVIEKCREAGIQVHQNLIISLISDAEIIKSGMKLILRLGHLAQLGTHRRGYENHASRCATRLLEEYTAPRYHAPPIICWPWVRLG